MVTAPSLRSKILQIFGITLTKCFSYIVFIKVFSKTFQKRFRFFGWSQIGSKVFQFSIIFLNS